MTDRRPIIEIGNGKKDFGQFTALNGINLSITQGEIVTLLDPSGSGKTTLMRIIAGFDRLSSGTLKIDGKNVAAPAPEKHPVTWCSSNTCCSCISMFSRRLPLA